MVLDEPSGAQLQISVGAHDGAGLGRFRYMRARRIWAKMGLARRRLGPPRKRFAGTG